MSKKRRFGGGKEVGWRREEAKEGKREWNGKKENEEEYRSIGWTTATDDDYVNRIEQGSSLPIPPPEKDVGRDSHVAYRRKDMEVLWIE